MAINGHKLVRRDRRGKRGRDLVLYVKNWIEYKELLAKNNCEQVESLWVCMRDQDNQENIVVGVYYRPPGQAESIDEAFLGFTGFHPPGGF